MDKKLRAQQIAHNKEMAYFWLACAREPERSNVPDCIEHVRKELSMSGWFTIADIGTTEEELETLAKNSCKRNALEFLGCAREGSGLKFIGIMREYLAQGGFALSDVDTNEEELKSITEQYA